MLSLFATILLAEYILTQWSFKACLVCEVCFLKCNVNMSMLEAFPVALQYLLNVRFEVGSKVYCMPTSGWDSNIRQSAIFFGNLLAWRSLKVAKYTLF